MNKCFSCSAVEIKYTCPSCLVKSCSLVCVNSHKLLMNCSGIRDKVKFIRKLDMNMNVLMNDISFLQSGVDDIDRRERLTNSDGTNSTSSVFPSDNQSKSRRAKLKKALRFKGIQFLEVSEILSRRKINLSYVYTVPSNKSAISAPLTSITSSSDPSQNASIGPEATVSDITNSVPKNGPSRTSIIKWTVGFIFENAKELQSSFDDSESIETIALFFLNLISRSADEEIFIYLKHKV